MLALVVNHLCALITHSSPSRTAVARIWVGIGARHLGLGETDRGRDVAGHQRPEVALALLFAGVAVVHDRVLHGGGADADLAPVRPSHDLVEEDEVHEGQAAAAELLGMADRPHAAALGLFLEAVERLAGDRRLLVERGSAGITSPSMNSRKRCRSSRISGVIAYDMGTPGALWRLNCGARDV